MVMGPIMRTALLLTGSAYGCIFGPVGGPLLILYLVFLRAIVRNTLPNMTIKDGRISLDYPDTNIVTRIQNNTPG